MISGGNHPCRVAACRHHTGGEFLLWAAGTERPEEGLEELFTAGRDGIAYCGTPTGGETGLAAIVLDADGEARGRAVLTLYENVTYFWRWRDDGGTKPTSSLEVSAAKAEWAAYQEKDSWRGQFRVMNYLGFAWIEVGGTRIRLEIQTRKLDYEREYHRMVEAIAAECQQLLLEWDSPVAMNLSSDPEQQARTLLERFLFLRHVLAPDRIDFFLEMVRRRPHTQLLHEESWEPAACAGSSRLAEDPVGLGRDWRRVSGPGLAGSGWMPGEIRCQRKYETLDTPPNRFLRFALEQFRDTCAAVVREGERWPVATAEARDLLDTLDAFLTDPFFDDVGDMRRLPLDSQVLQKREGYRDILLAWLLHDAAAKLNWPGRGEAYDGTNRNVATLYEYWLFYRIRSLLKSQPLAMQELTPASPVPDDAPPFVHVDANGLQVNLQEGKCSLCRFDWQENGRRLRVHLYYNRTFAHSIRPGISGSYTRPLKPDYTLVLLPHDIAEADEGLAAEVRAEKEGRIAYLHFDAKYRVEDLTRLFGAEDEEDPDQAAHYGNYKRGDLYKMHTYADAIRRTTGAFVLYPGSEDFRQSPYEEILPGVGAFPMRPGVEEEGQANCLAQFIRDALLHHVNEFSRDYRIRHWTRRTLRETPAVSSLADDPAPDVQPPSDIAVLQGYIRPEHQEICRNQGVFFYHAVEASGRTTPLDPTALDARFLVPYCGGQWLGWWAEMRERKLVALADLATRLGTDPSQHTAQYYYLIELGPPQEFVAQPGMSPPQRGAAPRVCSWSELMS